MKIIFTAVLLLLSSSLLAHGNHHRYDKSKGGKLLKGYPWGIFNLNEAFSNRVNHSQNDQELELSNIIFENIANETRIAFPINLENQGYKPFGDGQSNGQANFAFWNEAQPPLIAKFHHQSKIEIEFHSKIITNGKIKVFSKSLGEFEIVESNGKYEFSIDQVQLKWNELIGGEVIYIKPSHWGDWFPIKFQNPFINAEQITKNFPGHLIRKTIPNALELDAEESNPPLIQLMNKYKKNDYLLFTSDKVHSIYPAPGPNAIEKTSGGNWTFLLNPSHWENQNRSTFKQLYSCFEGRAHWEESMKKSVSGTSWHHVGDEGEIILNTIQNEDRTLIAGVGEKINPPNGINLAYGLNHVGYTGQIKPGKALVSVKGTYHWHPIHTSEPICVEVWTPQCVPTKNNNYGFNCP